MEEFIGVNHLHPSPSLSPTHHHPMASSPIMLPLLLLLLSMPIITFAADSSWRSNDEVRRLHKEWMVEHSRSYSTPDEEESRFKIFKHNLRYIDEHNAVADRGERTFRLGLTRFADLTNEEYRTMYLGQRIPNSASTASSNRYLPLATDELPCFVDWRERGAVTAIKDQGSCGSCWAFSTISTVESINQIVTRNLIILSEQQLVDCDASSYGCNGGYVDSAFGYIIQNGGIASNATYPYTGIQQQCNYPTEKLGRIDWYEYVPWCNEQAMKKAVANQPISVLIDASGHDFQFYTLGIFSGYCGTSLNHAVVVVGYGNENGKDYWIVRNSWGIGWGDRGYIRMERNIGVPWGMCGIAMYPTYPIKLNELNRAMPKYATKSPA